MPHGHTKNQGSSQGLDVDAPDRSWWGNQDRPRPSSHIRDACGPKGPPWAWCPQSRCAQQSLLGFLSTSLWPFASTSCTPRLEITPLELPEYSTSASHHSHSDSSGLSQRNTSSAWHVGQAPWDACSLPLLKGHPTSPRPESCYQRRGLGSMLPSRPRIVLCRLLQNQYLYTKVANMDCSATISRERGVLRKKIHVCNKHILIIHENIYVYRYVFKSSCKRVQQKYFHQDWMSQQHGDLHQIKVWDVFKLMEQENQQHLTFSQLKLIYAICVRMIHPVKTKSSSKK